MQTSNLFYWNKCITMITYLVSGIYTYFNGIIKHNGKQSADFKKLHLFIQKFFSIHTKKYFQNSLNSIERSQYVDDLPMWHM